MGRQDSWWRQLSAPEGQSDQDQMGPEQRGWAEQGREVEVGGQALAALQRCWARVHPALGSTCPGPTCLAFMGTWGARSHILKATPSGCACQVNPISSVPSLSSGSLENGVLGGSPPRASSVRRGQGWAWGSMEGDGL